jgi:branched-chain amino acid transport system permease protein
MALIGAAAVSGVATGLLYGMLAFSLVLLFKASGIPSFTQGNVATFGVFVVYLLATRTGMPLPIAMAAGLLGTAALGLVIYAGAIRPREEAGTLNLAVRTLAVYLVLFTAMNLFWGQGQPFTFPRWVPGGSVSLGGVRLNALALITALVALVLGTAFWLFYRSTSPGLLMRGVADRPDVARLLGADTRRLSALAWALAGAVALVVGLLTVPSALLSTDMMDGFFLYAFTAAVLGGLTSLPGAFAGGVAIGVVSSVASVLGGQELSVLAVFGLLILTMLVRPDGLLGHQVSERL